MCRQGGYYEQAAYLAKKHGETDLVVDILIEDSKNYVEALDYVWRQDPDIVRASRLLNLIIANMSRHTLVYRNMPECSLRIVLKMLPSYSWTTIQVITDLGAL
jgi:ABC-type Fe3+-citrate transport system substrate-binding protein